MKPRKKLSNLIPPVIALPIIMALPGCGDSGNNDASVPNRSYGRVASKLYDFDQNGIYEGLSTFRYDIYGRVVEERYTYTDDGTPDRNILNTDLSYGNTNSSRSYHYDSEGRLDIWTQTTANQRTTITYTFNSDNLVIRCDVTTQDSSGAEISEYYYLLEYEEQRLIQYTSHQNYDPAPYETVRLEYERRRFDMAHIIPNPQSSLSDYGIFGLSYPDYPIAHYRPSLIFISPPPVSTLATVYYRFTYSDDIQLILLEGWTRTNDDLDDYYSWSYAYGQDGRLTLSLLDDQQDGSTDVRVLTTWEDGWCSPSVIWEAGSITTISADPESPYQSGTGYRPIPVCDTGEF